MFKYSKKSPANTGNWKEMGNLENYRTTIFLFSMPKPLSIRTQ